MFRPAIVLFCFCILGICPAQTIIRPYLQNTQKNRATIIWAGPKSDQQVSVWYSSDFSFSRNALANQQEISAGLVLYKTIIENLDPNTRYFFRIEPTGFNSGQTYCSFQTQPQEIQDFEFLAVGDTAWNGPNQKAVIEAMAQEQNASFIIHLGDIAYQALPQEYLEHLNAFEPLNNIPVWPTLGNHDENPGKDEIPWFLKFFDLPDSQTEEQEIFRRYYSFDWSNVHFVSLDTNFSLFNAVFCKGKMLEWLENDLSGTDKDWIIVFLHHPAYAVGRHKNEITGELIRQRLVPILQKHGAHLVLNGHEHSYQRSQKICSGNGNCVIFVTSGGGGQPLYEVEYDPLLATTASKHHFVKIKATAKNIFVWALDTAGLPIDFFSIDKPIVRPVCKKSVFKEKSGLCPSYE